MCSATSDLVGNRSIDRSLHRLILAADRSPPVAFGRLGARSLQTGREGSQNALQKMLASVSLNVVKKVVNDLDNCPIWKKGHE